MFLLNLHCNRHMMAVASLFPFASLTYGRTARDLPKQHPQKNIKKVQSQDFQGLWAGPLWKATALLFVVYNDLGENLWLNYL